MTRLAIALLLLVGCGVYNVDRAALVPRATPRMTSGQPSPGVAAIEVGASSVAHFGEPKSGDASAGIEVPGTQLHGGLKFQMNDMASIGLIYANGLNQGAKAINPNQPPVDNGNVEGYGLSLDFTIPTSDKNFKIGLGVDAIMWSAPFVEYATCAEGESCFPFAISTRGSDNVETFSASVTPSYRTNETLTVFGGVTVRNHPTLKQRSFDNDPLFDDGVEVDSGPANFIVSGGVELNIADGALQASAIAYWDVSRTPVKYGPGLAVMVSLPIGRRHKPVPNMYAPPVYPPQVIPVAPVQPYTPPPPMVPPPYVPPVEPAPAPEPAPEPYPAPER